MNPLRHIIVSIILATGLVANAAWALDSSPRHADSRPLTKSGSASIRFMERSFPGQNCSSACHGRPARMSPEPEFQNFIDTEVTPRFPDGLTVLSGIGQFKDSAGTTVQEGSKLLILLYPFNKKSNLAVEEIRTEYKEDFQQQSVLRVDEQSCVSF